MTRSALVKCAGVFALTAATFTAQPQAIALADSCSDGASNAAVAIDSGPCADVLAQERRWLTAITDGDRTTVESILAPGFSLYDQWEAQILANIRLKARVGLLSEIPPDDVRRAHLEPLEDLGAAVTSELDRRGGGGDVAVLPEGPMTIPYLA
jgi:hypothetical protein